MFLSMLRVSVEHKGVLKRGVVSIPFGPVRTRLNDGAKTKCKDYSKDY